MQAEEMYDRNAQREKQDLEIRQSLARIKNTILVMSGKGGVGKSCIAVSIAVGLADMGYRVGLMDVDLHGPSVPQMLGLPNMHDADVLRIPELQRKAVTFSEDKIIPAQYAERLSVVSIECMLENNEKAVIWRGPMKIAAIRQFISDVRWDDLDYLIIDSPPGTGDEPLTVAQTIPGAKAVIVTTPQRVSLRDVRKSINFCRDVNMRMVGLIENMSGFVCPACGTATDLFKTGGGERAAREMNVAFLGKIPIIPDVVKACDDGVPAIETCAALRDAFGPILDSMGGKPKSDAPKQESAEPVAQKEAVMKIAIPVAQGRLSMHFGHCEEFALVEVDEREKKVVKEEMVPAPDHQPGLLPRWLHEQGANVIIAGGMGSRAQALFAENNIRVVTGVSSQDPAEIVVDYLNGSLVTGANVCDH